jgi:hypothetical protein
MKADQFTRTIEIRDRQGRVTGTKEVVTYQGLLSKAHDEGLKRIATSLVQIPSDDNGRTAIAKAEVETAKGFFEALGDASPENVNSFIVPHLIRMAETRAKARALRDAVNIGVISFEEMDDAEVPGSSEHSERDRPSQVARTPGNGRGESNTTPSRSNTGNGGQAPMTEPQRRFLFRLMASQGYEGSGADEELKTRFSVASLGDVSKAEAAAMIDRLLAGLAEGAPVPGTPQA